jgi:hypothetical protein
MRIFKSKTPFAPAQFQRITRLTTMVWGNSSRQGDRNTVAQRITTGALEPAPPLWQRAPSRDRNGRLLSDFMMRIPLLGSAPAARRERVCVELQSVFRDYAEQVHFADLNLRLNLVWISVESRRGLIPELAREIRRRIPEAVLIGHDWSEPSRRLPLLARLSRTLRPGGRRRELAPPDSGTG